MFPSAGAPPPPSSSSAAPSATTTTTASTSSSTEGHYARVDADQESGSDYWTCSECTCTTSGTYYTCPECRSLQDLFTYDDTRPPSEEELPLDELLRRRSRSRSKSSSKSRDGVSKSRRSRSRSRSASKEPDDKDARTKTKTSTLPKLRRDAPQDHPDAIVRARSRSRSRSKSLTREIVASFKEFRDKVTKGRSRSKSGDRASAEKEPKKEKIEKEAGKEKGKKKKVAAAEEEEGGPSTHQYSSTETGRPVNLGNGDVRIPIHIHVDTLDGVTTSETQDKDKAWKEVSSEKVTTRLVFHGGEGRGDRTLTLEQVTSLRTPETSRASEVHRDVVRPTEADMGAMPSPPLPTPTETVEQREEPSILAPVEVPLVSSSPSDQPCTSTSPDKSGTSPDKTPEESDVDATADAPAPPPPTSPAVPEPAAPEPVVPEPVVPEPVVPEPVVPEPVVPEPVVPEPVIPEPVVPEPVVPEPVVPEPAIPEPTVSEPVETAEEVVEDPLSPRPVGLPPRFPHSKPDEDELIRKMKKSAEWLELRVVELTPGMVYLGATLEEASQLQHAHEEVLSKLQSKQSPVEDLLNQADQLISTQRPRAEVYAAMAESLGLAWKDLNSQLETRKEILDMGVAFHSRARQYSDGMDAAERVYTDNVMPNDAEGARQLLSALHDHKRSILESSMYTLQEAQALLARLRSLAVEGATLDSRPLHIKTNIEFSCSQIEHYLESLHDRRRFLDGLFSARKHHLEQCLALCILYQDLTEVVTALKQLRDEVSDQQGLGESQGNGEILLHEHMKRQTVAKEIQDKCIMLLKQAEKMASSGHYAGLEARSRAYSVLEAATALHETCDTRAALLQQSILFFKLAQTALTKLDQAEVQVAGLGGEGAQRLSLVVGVVEEAIQPALAEGYAILEVTGGRNQPHNLGISLMVEELERRRSHLSSVCVTSTEQVLQRTELSNAFLEQYNTIESWLVRIGDAFLQGHQDPGGSLSLARDFLHLHQTLNHDVLEKKNEIDALVTFLETLTAELSPEDVSNYNEKMQTLIDHWTALKKLLDFRIMISEKYVKFHEAAEAVNNEHESLELLLKDAQGEDRRDEVEAKWEQVQKLYLDLCNTGKAFCQDVRSVEDPYLDSNRAVLCVENILEQLGKRRLVITDLHSHFHMKITTTKEMVTLWNTYRENVTKMQQEMLRLETDFCPLLRGDPTHPEEIANTLEGRLNAYVAAMKKTQEDIQNMMTRAEVMSYKGDQAGARDEVVGALLQLYQSLQNKTTEYQILGHMLIQWCKNIAEIHRSCDKLESQFGAVSPDIGGVEGQIREHEASKQAVLELLRFAQNEAANIVTKIREQCPPEAGAQDIALIEEMLQRRGQVFESVWTQHQQLLERQLKKSQYHVDLQVISDQLRDLSEQLTRMRGHYGDSLAAAMNMQSAFMQFQITVDMLERRIQTFVSTTVMMLGPEDDSGEVQQELAELENKWSTFQMQVGQSNKSIELSIDFYKLVEEAEDWFKQGSKLLVAVAGDSANIQNPEEAERLRSRIEVFLQPGQVAQQERISRISSLALQLYGDTVPKQIEVVTHQHTHMIESFTIINRNLTMMVENLRTADEHREKQKKEKEQMEASLAAAQAEAEVARLAAAAAEEAKKAAEEVAKAMAIPVEPIVPERVEIEIQTEAIPLPEPEEEPPRQEDVPPPKKAKMIDDEPQPMAPVFLTPLVGATITEGVKFSFECRVIGFPMPEVEWLKDNMSITANPDYKTSFEEGICTLTIEETFTEDSALFTCRAGNAAGIAETSATLVVKEAEIVEVMAPPNFTKKLADCTAQEGASYQLEATVEGHPLPVVSWAKDGSCVDESPDYVITYNNGDCVLRFEEVFLEDQAEYSCQATNDLGEDITKAKLTVAAVELSERPKFTMTLSNIMARAGQKFKLECHVTGTPTPTVAWFHNSKPVKETLDCKINFDGKVATLVMSEAFPKNAGSYTVVAKNSAGEAQCSGNVSVKGRIPTETSDSEVTSDVDVEPIKPTIQLALKDTSVKEGKSARLDCVIVGQPEPEVIWYHDDTPVKESTDFKLLFHGDRCSLIIQEAFLEDAGIYRVVAMNSAGEASTACFLNVEPEPELAPPTSDSPAVAPRFSELMTDSHVTEGKPVTLSAIVTGEPTPTIAWFREGLPLIPDNELQIHEDDDGCVSAEIYAATLDHTGQYEIVASNCAGTAKCVAYLSIEPRLPTPPLPAVIQEPPVFTRSITDASVEAGSGVKFEAEVTGRPVPTVSPDNCSMEAFLDLAQKAITSELNRNDKSEQEVFPWQIGNYISDVKCDEESEMHDSFCDLERALEMEEENCKNISVLGKDDFANLMSTLYKVKCLPSVEENNNEVNDDKINNNLNGDDSFSQLSQFQSMKVLDSDSYSRFMMDNIVVYGAIDETGDSVNCFEQFYRYDDLKVMDSTDYASLIVDGYDSDGESSVDLGNDSMDEDDHRILSVASNGIYSTRFMDTGLGQDIPPVKLADLWNLIKDTLPPPEVEPESRNTNNENNDNRKSSAATSESEPESGYFSGNFVSASDGTDSSSPASKRSSSVISSADSSKRNSISETLPLNLSVIPPKKTDEDFNDTLMDQLSKVSLSSPSDNPRNIKSPNRLTKKLNEDRKELSTLSECSADLEMETSTDPLEGIQNGKRSEDHFGVSGDLSLKAAKQEERAIFRYNLHDTSFKENIWKSCNSDMGHFLGSVSDDSFDHLRCSSVLSVISEEESYISDCEEVSFPSEDKLVKDIEKPRIGAHNFSKQENPTGVQEYVTANGQASQKIRSEENSTSEQVSSNHNGQAAQNFNVNGNHGKEDKSTNTNVKGNESMDTNVKGNESTDQKDAERRARRAARLVKLRELTRILRGPSKLSFIKTQEETDKMLKAPASEPSQSISNGAAISEPSVQITQHMFINSGSFMQGKPENSQELVGDAPTTSSSKAVLFLIETAEKISKVHFMKIIVEKLRSLIKAGHSLLRAYIFPFSQASILDLTNPFFLQQDFDRLPTDEMDETAFEASILSSENKRSTVDEETSTNFSTPALIEAGCYFIILCYNEAPDM